MAQQLHIESLQFYTGHLDAITAYSSHFFRKTKMSSLQHRWSIYTYLLSFWSLRSLKLRIHTCLSLITQLVGGQHTCALLISYSWLEGRTWALGACESKTHTLIQLHKVFPSVSGANRCSELFILLLNIYGDMAASTKQKYLYNSLCYRGEGTKILVSTMDHMKLCLVIHTWSISYL